MKRLPEIAFAVLAAATIGAFFLIQVIKVNDAFIYGASIVPAVFDPKHGRVSSCISKTHELINYRQTELTFYAAESERVGVYIVKASHPYRAAVATISAHTYIAKGDSHAFAWHGRLSNGRVASNDSRFDYKIILPKQKRSIPLTNTPVRVMTSPPAPRIARVHMLSGNRTKIYYSHGPYRRVWIDIYRTDGKKSQRVWRVPADRTGTWAIWNGEVDDKPAPAATYLVGITAQNLACDQVSTPAGPWSITAR